MLHNVLPWVLVACLLAWALVQAAGLDGLLLVQLVSFTPATRRSQPPSALYSRPVPRGRAPPDLGDRHPRRWCP